MRKAAITLFIQDISPGFVAVDTNANKPAIGQTVTPAESLAMDLLRVCAHQATQTNHLQATADVMLMRTALRRLLDPEDLGHAATAEIRDLARVALGKSPVETSRYTCSNSAQVSA